MDLMDVIAQYLTPAEMADLKDAVTMSEEDYLGKRFPVGEVVHRHQGVTAKVVPVEESFEAEGFPLCTLILNGEATENVAVRVSLGGDLVVSRNVAVRPGGSTSEIIRLPDSHVGVPNDSHCTVTVIDSVGRLLARSEFDIGFVPRETGIGVDASIILDGYPEEGIETVCLATVGITSREDSVCAISAYADDDLLVSRTLKVPAGGTITKRIGLGMGSYPSSASWNLRVVVESSGKVIREGISEIRRHNPDGGRPFSPESKPSERDVFADCNVASVIDVHDLHDNNVVMGEVAVENRTTETQAVVLEASFNGDVVMKKRIDIRKGCRRDTPLVVPSTLLLMDDTSKIELECRVYDCDGLLILDRTSTVTVRSRFDMNLERLKEHTARFVNPLDPCVKELVVPRDGPVAKAMLSTNRIFTIDGYQSEEGPSRMMRAAFDAVRGLNLSYVSDVSTLRDEGCYQRVRTPAKVLQDGSGNCIELSILFASMFETMGLEPVVVFPPGHAIVGIVTSTDLYPTKSGGRMGGLPYKPVRFNSDKGHFFEGVFIESTICAQRGSTFEDAVGMAHALIRNHSKGISQRQDYSLISMYRFKGVKPEVSR